jgi:DNA repair protein RecN (Recombination protein N)
MLRTIVIKDLALIENAVIELRPGLTVWTGETGAGKSLLLSAISLVLGARADAAVVRTGKPEAVVSCTFDLPSTYLRDRVETILGESLDDDCLILTRRISADRGRSLAQANAVPVPVKTLQQLARLLVEYVGQHQTRSLMEPATQTILLDQFGEIQALVSDYDKNRLLYEELRQQRVQQTAEIGRMRRERQLLEFELEELDRLEPIAGEPAKLLEEVRWLGRIEEVQRISSECYQRLYGKDGSVHEMMTRLVRKLSPIIELSPRLKNAGESLRQSMEHLEESADLLQSESDEAESDPRRLEQLESRLAEYRRLALRFGIDENDLELTRSSHRAKLAEFEGIETSLADFGPIRSAWEACQSLSARICQRRRDSGTMLAQQLPTVLSRLGMEQARIDLTINPADFSADPADLPALPADPAPISMLFCPNPGEEARPLERIASGGELSRLLLAMMVCLSRTDRIPTVIFDEIDTGVGGRLGSAIGEVLAELAAHHQVICITHLPQIASFAADHHLVKKSGRGERTETSIELLTSDEDRLAELASMLRGKNADKTTFIEAQAMLDQARLFVNQQKTEQVAAAEKTAKKRSSRKS